MHKKILRLIMALLSFSTLFASSTYFAYAASGMASSDFTFTASDLSPAKSKWDQWPKENVKELLSKISRYLMITITSLAVLFIVVWGIKIITAWWESAEIQNWKKIITYNLIWVVVALLSYSIINLVIWIIWSST